MWRDPVFNMLNIQGDGKTKLIQWVWEITSKNVLEAFGMEQCKQVPSPLYNGIRTKKYHKIQDENEFDVWTYPQALPLHHTNTKHIDMSSLS